MKFSTTLIRGCAEHVRRAKRQKRKYKKCPICLEAIKRYYGENSQYSQWNIADGQHCSMCPLRTSVIKDVGWDINKKHDYYCLKCAILFDEAARGNKSAQCIIDEIILNLKAQED